MTYQHKPTTSHQLNRHPNRADHFTRPMDEILATETVLIERKEFRVSRRRNSQGEYLEISEKRLGNYPPSRIKVPMTGISDLTLAIQKVCP